MVGRIENPQFPFLERTIYEGLTVKEYEMGPILYELQGVKDDYESPLRLGMIVMRQGDVYFSLKNPQKLIDSLSIKFKANKEETQTPFMAEKLARVPKNFFENDGKWLNDFPEFEVNSLQDKLMVDGSSESIGGYIRGLAGDGDHRITMNLAISDGGDVGIALVRKEPYLMLGVNYAASPAGGFHSGIRNEFRAAARDIIVSRASFIG